MSAPLMIDAVMEGGPVDGAELHVPETIGYLLAAVRNEVHGYAWANRTAGKGRWVYRHERLLAVTGEGTRAADVLRAKGQQVVELVPGESAE
jgi:hypothetical protein